MNHLQRIQIKLSELRSAINEELGKEEPDREVLENLRKEVAGYGVEERAALVAVEQDDLPEDTEQTPEDAQLTELRSRLDFGKYIAAAVSGSGVMMGAEKEYNDHLNLQPDQFDLSLLVDDEPVETRAKLDGDSATRQGSWLDRLFAGSAASRVGISMRSVQPGVQSYPVMTSGGGGVQRGRQQKVAESAYQFNITEIKPSRISARASYTVEDAARLPGLSDAIRRDLNAGLRESMDRAMFLGDASGNEADAKIIGLNTHADVAEIAIQQQNKAKGPETLSAFVGLVDGIYAMIESDLQIVASVGANQLWRSTIVNAAASNETIAGFLMANGINWTTRGELSSATTAGAFGAFIGLRRGIAGAGIHATWVAASLVRDIYSKADSGETVLTLNALHGFKLPRPQNFRRLKFTANA